VKRCNFWVSVSPGSAEALVRWGGKIKYILIAWFNICAKNCRNRTVYVKITASYKGGTFFETQCTYVGLTIVTEKQIDHATRSVTTARTAMWPNTYSILVNDRIRWHNSRWSTVSTVRSQDVMWRVGRRTTRRVRQTKVVCREMITLRIHKHKYILQ